MTICQGRVDTCCVNLGGDSRLAAEDAAAEYV